MRAGEERARVKPVLVAVVVVVVVVIVVGVGGGVVVFDCKA